MQPSGNRLRPILSWRVLRSVLFLLVMVTVAAIVCADFMCKRAAAGRIFHDTESVPERTVALLLGTGRLTSGGDENEHFTRRIEAAAELFHAGKIRHVIVSGDNHLKEYDEPSDMRDALMEAGVPTNAITCDYAGFRTLDSVVRAGSVFGLKEFVIVTENFHCPRALWIARGHGMDAVAFAAPDTDIRWSARVRAREVLARVLCGLDLYVLRTQPKFPGPPEPLALAEVNP
jgi:SanA protein